MIEITKNRDGEEIITWVNEDGSGGSMLKSVYDEQQAALAEQAKLTK